MDFFANFQGSCPVHFPVNANDMTFFDNDGDQIQWGGFDMEEAPNQLVCLCPEYFGHDDGDRNNAGELLHAGPPAEDNMTIGGQSLAHPAPAPGAISNSSTPPKSHQASGSASADPAAPPTLSPKRFTCDHCGSISAKTPRDFNRHLATAKHRRNASRSGDNEVALEELQAMAPSTGFRCPVSTCNGKTFPRKDNLWRHIAKMHGISDREE